LASSAPPTSFATISGSFSSNLVAERKSHDLPSWSSFPLQSSELRLRPLAPSPIRPLQEGTISFQSHAGLPLMGFLLPRTRLRRVPLFRYVCFLSETRTGRRSPNPHRRRPQGFYPSRRFWLARGSLGVFETPPFAVALDALRPSLMPLASLKRPFRAFPSREAVPALAGLLLPCEFTLDCRRRSACGSFTIAFTCRASPLPIEPTLRRTRDS